MKKLSQKEREKIVEKYFGKIPKGKFTPGIYNYCDRWCEKCKKQEKCFLRYQELREREGLVSEGIDPSSSEAIFNRINNSLDKTKDLILDITRAEGIDISMTPEEERQYELEKRRTDPARYKVMKLAKELFKETHFFIESLPPLESQELNEEIEKICHHSVTVVCKVFSAMSGKLHAKYEKGSRAKFWLDDSFKTACVAYRSAKISRGALETLEVQISDFRFKSLIDRCDKLLTEIDRSLFTNQGRMKGKLR